MISLVKYLCDLLKCSRDELPATIRVNPFRVALLLEGVHLYHTPPVTERTFGDEPPRQLTPVRVDGVTKAGVNTLFACGGHLGITVEQFYFIRHGRTLRYPQLQCIVQQQGDYGGQLYMPIESVRVEQGKHA